MNMIGSRGSRLDCVPKVTVLGVRPWSPIPRCLGCRWQALPERHHPTPTSCSKGAFTCTYFSSGAVVLIGLDGATAFGGGAGTTIGSMYLNTGGHGSTGFCGIMIPGDSLRFENRSLDEFRVTCIAGHGGQTQASVIYRTY